jgi:hypothetical protein
MRLPICGPSGKPGLRLVCWACVPPGGLLMAGSPSMLRGWAVSSVGASPGELLAWREAAVAAGLSCNAWKRRALNEAAQFEAALLSLEVVF